MENKGLAKLKDNNFEYIKVTGQPDQFSDLKHFCFDDITITYETCAVDDFWCITLDDCLKEKQVVVPNGDYIFRLSCGYTLISAQDFNEYFADINNDQENIN